MIQTFAEPTRFNRYMVECESIPLTSTGYVRRGFNRYMVECEYYKLTSYWFTYIVLIDTWWNVNKSERAISIA